MHSARARRVGLSALVLLALALPAAAQPRRERGVSLEQVISLLWERLSTPPISRWVKERGCIDPDGAAAPCPAATTSPLPSTDGRGMIDPDG
jgi:hypothetical protein